MAFNTYINNRLNQWAAWVYSRSCGALGYPTRCAFVRLAGEGDPSSRVPMGIDEQSWEVERAVQELQPELKQSIMEFYCRIGTIEQKATYCKCTRQTLYNRLDRAHNKILDLLNSYACE